MQRARTVAWFDAIADRPDVDADRIAAVGFCYGGMCVLELARSGADLGVAHGFTDPESAVLQLDGVEYDALANDLSWTGTLVLLEHVFR